MILDRFSEIPPEERPPLMEALQDSLDEALPGLQLVEARFPVPGRGDQAAVATNQAGRIILVEYAREPISRLSSEVLARIAWFEENRSLMRRLFRDHRIDPDPAPQVLLLAPGYSEPFLRTAASLPFADFHLIRVRFLQTEPVHSKPVQSRPVKGFFLEDALSPDRLHPFAAPAEESPRSIDSYHPIQSIPPSELLDRSRHWFSKLSPEIQTRIEGDSTTFTFSHQILAVMTPETDHLRIDVPDHGALLVRDMHELNQGMNPVIKRYFGLVGPGTSSRTPLKKEDILTEKELAEFLDTESDGE